MSTVVINTASTLVVTDTPSASLVVQSTNTDKVVTAVASGPRGERGINAISAATDIDVTNLAEGSTLVYDSTNSKWLAYSSTAVKILSADTSQIINGATLTYNATTDTWQATNVLENQIVSAGFF